MGMNRWMTAGRLFASYLKPLFSGREDISDQPTLFEDVMKVYQLFLLRWVDTCIKLSTVALKPMAREVRKKLTKIVLNVNTKIEDQP